MGSSNLSALLLLMLFISSTPIALACGSCPTRYPRTPTPSPRYRRSPETPRSPKSPKGPISSPPPIIVMPPITIPPIIGGTPPKSPKGPISSPPPIIGMPPITVPPIIGGTPTPITLPPIGMPPINMPPITIPPIIGGTPPVTGTPPPVTGKPGCGVAPPPAATTCPLDALKLGACVDLLGSTVNFGDAQIQCCPLLGGLAGVQAALCLCTTIKAKLLNIDFYLPIALQILITCGNSAPPGYTCPK